MTKAYSDSAMQCLAKDAGYGWELVLGYVNSRLSLKDIETLMEGLDAHNVYRVQLGRVLNDDNGGPAKDAITAGLQSLTAGTKSPLSKYNKASCLLLSQTN